MPIPLTRPTLRRRDYNSVLNCLVSDQIAPGPLNQEFAAALGKTLGAAGGIALMSYSGCIHCAFDLLGLQQGDGVLISALTPRQYLQIIESRGLRAVVADVEPEGVLLAADSLRRPARVDVKAIVLYYTLGSMPKGEEIFELGVPVIEDVTEAVGGAWGGRPCGSRGRAAVASLAPGGLITAGCGGAVFTQERRMVRPLKELAAGGYAGQLLPDMNAALGLSQVRELSRFLHKRSEIGRLFRDALLRSRHSPLLGEGEGVDFTFPILVKDGRPDVRRYAEKRGIQAEAAFTNAAAAVEEGARGAAGGAGAGAAFPRAQQLLWRGLLFPLYPSLGRKDVQLMCKVLSTLP